MVVHTWPEVLGAIDKAVDKYAAAGKLRRVIRKVGDYAPILKSWMTLFPNISYSGTLLAGMTIALNVGQSRDSRSRYRKIANQLAVSGRGCHQQDPRTGPRYAQRDPLPDFKNKSLRGSLQWRGLREIARPELEALRDDSRGGRPYAGLG